MGTNYHAADEEYDEYSEYPTQEAAAASSSERNRVSDSRAPKQPAVQPEAVEPASAPQGESSVDDSRDAVSEATRRTMDAIAARSGIDASKIPATTPKSELEKDAEGTSGSSARTPESDYHLPSTNLLIPGERPKTRTATNDRMIEALSLIHI